MNQFHGLMVNLKGQQFCHIDILKEYHDDI